MFNNKINHSLPSVLVLDGNQRSTLAVVRSLGKRGIPVIVGESTARSIAGVSRFCWRQVQYPSPENNPEKFLAWLVQLAQQDEVRWVLPITDITTAIVLKNRAAFGEKLLPFPAWNEYEALTNKCSLVKRAKELDVTVPETYCIRDSGDLPSVIENVRFPAIVKAANSKVWNNSTWRATGVKYVNSREQLVSAVSQLPWDGQSPIMIQQCILGEGQGVFALCDQGRPLIWFAHKRVREKPPSGGVSVLSESIPLDMKLKESAQKILASARWHGVAMLEFKVTKDGQPFLIEINGRFWGSLQLAVDSGADFPFALYQLANGQTVDTKTSYVSGRMCRWLLGDLDRLYLVLKNQGGFSIGNKLRAIKSFIWVRAPGVRHEVNRISDIRPFLLELAKYLRLTAR